VRVQRHAPAAFYTLERPGTHCTGGWLGPRAGLDRCGKCRPPPGFDPRTVQPVVSRYTDWATRPTTGCKGIWEFSEWLRLFLASNVYGSDWSPSRTGRFNPGYMSLPTHWIRRRDGSQRRLGSSAEKRHRLPRPDIGLCLFGCRGYSLDQGCEPVARGKFSLARGMHCFPNFIYFSPSSISTFWRICVYINISDYIEIVHELPLLPNSTANEIFFLNKSGAVRSVDWIFITGTPAGRRLGEYSPILLPHYLPFLIIRRKFMRNIWWLYYALIIVCIKNNTVLNNFGRHQDQISRFKIPMDKRNHFFEKYKIWGTRPLKSFTNPRLGAVLSDTSPRLPWLGFFHAFPQL
jgi:hypothetical protein